MTQQNFWTTAIATFLMNVWLYYFQISLKKYQCGKYNYQCNHLVVAPLFSSRLHHIFLHVSISILHRNRTHRTSSSTYYYVLVRILKRVGSFSTKYFSMCVCVCVGLFVSSRRSSPGESPTHRRSYYYRQPPGSSPGTRCRAGRANPGIYSLMGERVAM